MSTNVCHPRHFLALELSLTEYMRTGSPLSDNNEIRRHDHAFLDRWPVIKEAIANYVQIFRRLNVESAAWAEHDTETMLTSPALQREFKEWMKERMDKMQEGREFLFTNLNTARMLTLTELYKALCYLRSQIDTERIEQERGCELRPEEQKAMQWLDLLMQHVPAVIVRRGEDFMDAPYEIE